VSHFTNINTEIRDLKALENACQELGLDLIENANARGYGRNHIKGEYVIKLKGPYDIALNRNDDGSYALTTDWWHGHVEKEVGKNFGKLLQFYGVCKARSEAHRKGYTTRRQYLKDGSIKLTIGGIR
jgi:hypothetical protein